MIDLHIGAVLIGNQRDGEEEGDKLEQGLRRSQERRLALRDNFWGERRRACQGGKGGCTRSPIGGAPAMSLDSFTRAWPRSAPSVLSDDECCSL